MALGMIEVFGFTTSIVVADKMAKAADVKIVAIDKNKPAAGDAAQVPLVMAVKAEGSAAAVAAVVLAGTLLWLLLRYLTFRCPQCRRWGMKRFAEELLYEEPSVETESVAAWSDTDKAYHSHELSVNCVRRGYQERYRCRFCGQEQTRIRVVSGKIGD